MIANSLDRRQGGADDNDAQANHLVSVPLTRRYGKGVNTTMDDGAMVVGSGVRRLTPTECERLQGFPDGWTIVNPDGTPNPKPDGPRYSQMGNAVTVQVIEWIGRRLMEAA